MTLHNSDVKKMLGRSSNFSLCCAVCCAGTHHWSSFIQPQELARMLRDSGLRVADVHGMVYNPINNTWRLVAAKTDVNYILHARKDASK
jgi:2-polyprenyl-6-hydroxyphenyl methylase/3-demethylubiquinone-9 3-methyltransferase